MNKKKIIGMISITIVLLILGSYSYINNKNAMNMEEKIEDNKNIEDYSSAGNEDNEEIDGKSINEEEVKKESVKKEIVISFAGDCTLGTDSKFSYDRSLPAAFINSGKDYSYFMQNVYSTFNEDDYTLVNLETTLTNSEVKAYKGDGVVFNFKGPEDYVNILTKGSIEGVTIANNHIYDYGKEGLEDTVNALNKNNIDICGEGYKILKDIKGVKFGFLGYVGWQYSDELKAKITNDINELKDEGAEIVIPYFHWGLEGEHKPYDVQENLARFAIDNGADAVIGSHPHVIQSMENYKGKLIAYSMGNFCFGGNFNPSDKRTLILQIKANIEDDKLVNFEYKVLPAMVSSRSDLNDYIPTLADSENKSNILKSLNELSPTLNGNIKDEFFEIEKLEIE